MRRRSSVLTMLLVALIALPATALGTAAFLLGEHGFDWSTSDAETAYFEWNAEVTNDSGRAARAIVAVELLDNDDQIVHTDSVSLELQAGETRTVRDQGSLPLTEAANVMQFRFRVREPEEARLRRAGSTFRR